MDVTYLQLSVIGLLATTSSCVQFPKSPDLERGACVVALPDREVCTEMTLLACFDIHGEFDGVGSTCESHGSQGDLLGPDLPEPTPLYLNSKVISAFGGAITVAVGQWALNRRRRKRGAK